MIRIDHTRVVWIQYGEDRRRYAVPAQHSAAHVARGAYVSFANIQGKAHDFPRNTNFLLREVTEGQQIVPSNLQAKELREGATYELVLETED